MTDDYNDGDYRNPPSGKTSLRKKRQAPHAPEPQRMVLKANEIIDIPTPGARYFLFRNISGPVKMGFSPTKLSVYDATPWKVEPGQFDTVFLSTDVDGTELYFSYGSGNETPPGVETTSGKVVVIGSGEKGEIQTHEINTGRQVKNLPDVPVGAGQREKVFDANELAESVLIAVRDTGGVDELRIGDSTVAANVGTPVYPGDYYEQDEGGELWLFNPTASAVIVSPSYEIEAE